MDGRDGNRDVAATHEAVTEGTGLLEDTNLHFLRTGSQTSGPHVLPPAAHLSKASWSPPALGRRFPPPSHSPGQEQSSLMLLVPRHHFIPRMQR